jgi:hypothetical protein
VYITILDERATFDWSPRDPDNPSSAYGTVFTLQQVPDDIQENLRKPFTKTEWRRGQRIIDVDQNGYIDACLKYAIVGWTGMYKVDPKTRTRAEIPCTDAYKLLLPEWVKAEIIRMCIGKEAGLRMDSEEATVTVVEVAKQEGKG